MGLVADTIRAHSWDFTDARNAHGVHSVHPYPAKFIPQIPRQVIQLFPPHPGSVVLDPFCGSGTTLVEAISAGIPAVGVDLNPLATLVAKVKTTPLTLPLLPLAKQLVRRASEQAATIPHIPRLDHWFEKSVQDVLARLVRQIDGVQDETTRNALRVALSRIIVRVSNQESDTRYAAIKKNVTRSTVCNAYVEAVRAIENALTGAYGSLFATKAECRILTRDILKVQPEEIGRNVGLVITSPPYPNAYEYWLYHKYRMYWLGMDPISVRTSEIGARPHYFRKNYQTEHDFERQMGKCFLLLSQVMLRDSIACFLVGSSVIHGRQIDNGAILERAAKHCGFRTAARVSRNIPNTHRAFNPTHGRINSEEILVFALRGP